MHPQAVAILALVLLLTVSEAALGQDVPRVEFFAGYSYINADAQTRHGAHGLQGNFKFNVSPRYAIVADGGGQYWSDADHPPVPDLFFLNLHERYLHIYQALGGVEFTRRAERWDIFGHTLSGLVHGGNRGETSNFAALAFGGGATVHGQSGPALRFQADYIPNRGGGVWHHDVRLGVGIVFTILR
jgi:hypothetical protein